MTSARATIFVMLVVVCGVSTGCKTDTANPGARPDLERVMKNSDAAGAQNPGAGSGSHGPTTNPIIGSVDAPVVVGTGSGSASGSASTAVPVVASGAAMTDDGAKAFLKDACASCHELGKGALSAQWALDTSLGARDAVTAKSAAAAVYWSAKEKSHGLAAGDPAPMPPGTLDAATLSKLAQFAAWFEAALPDAVAAAHAAYEKADATSDATPVILSYACRQPLTFRAFVARVTNDFFDRPPTPTELQLGGSNPDHAVTADDRAKLADRMFALDGWLGEFQGKALKKFADRLGGGPALKALPGVSDEALRDLKDEFYRLLLAKYQVTSYQNILLGNDLLATQQTSPLYGCAFSGSGWKSCKMAAPRGSYFTSVSYLLSKPSSFLADNNNYGRTKLLHFFIGGDVFKSALDGDAGTGAVPPLPACLKTKDWRGTWNADKSQIAPNGAAAVPATGVFCQSCHLARNLAAGAILFRPFTPSGLIYETQTRLALDTAIDEATNERHVNKQPGGTPEQVTEAMLAGWLSDPGEHACAADQSGGGHDVPLASVRDLAAYLIGDGAVLATGLARHLPRILSNQGQTTDEIVGGIAKALHDNQGLLGAAFKSYLLSETYACAAGTGG